MNVWPKMFVAWPNILAGFMKSVSNPFVELPKLMGGPDSDVAKMHDDFHHAAIAAMSKTVVF